MAPDAAGDIAVFVAVVEAGGFSPAARRLGLTHSAVSKKVRRLEDRLGARLLNRTTRRLGLTEAGERYWREARAVLDRIEAMEAAVAGHDGAPRGTLKVSCSNAFGHRQLLPAVADFARRHPGVSVDLTLSDAMADLVADGIDVAIRSAALVDSTLVARKLASNDRLICAAPDYIARRGAPEAAADLADHDCLKLNLPSRFNDWEFQSESGRRTVRIDGRFACNSVEALHAACLAGLGIARLPEFLVGDDLAAGRLVALLEDCRAPSESAIHAVRPPGDVVPSKTRAFIDFLVGRFTPVPPWRR